ncbi:MAG: hypothetical protein QOD30_624, partial [Actinomycetota bacterium]|nr:hypothetical protein [Actinomycetota bacterium]
EPSSGIAQKETEALGPLLLHLRDHTGASLIVVEHDMPLIQSISDELLALETGAVLLRGTPQEVINDPRLVASYLGTDQAVIERSGSSRGVSTHQADDADDDATELVPVIDLREQDVAATPKPAKRTPRTTSAAKAAPKKVTTRKTAAKKATSAPKKAAAAKAVAKRTSTARSANAKKTTAKKSTTTKKAPARKATAKKTSSRSTR